MLRSLWVHLTLIALILQPTAALSKVEHSDIDLRSGAKIKVGDTNGNLDLDANGTGQVRSGSDFSLRSAKDFRLFDSDNSNSIGFSAPSNVTGNYTLEMPAAAPTEGQTLVVNSGGNFDWGTGGGGSGAGAVNYIDTSSKAWNFSTNTTGWSTFKDAAATTPVDGTAGTSALTITRNTTTPLNGLGDLKVEKTASNLQGEGFAVDVAVPSGYQFGQKSALNFIYDFSAQTAAGDWKVYVYDVTNSTLITPTVLPGGGNAVPKAKGKLTLVWDQTTAASFRLFFYNTSTSASAYSVYVDDVVFGAGSSSPASGGSYLYEAVTSYTLGASSSAPTPGSGSTYYRRTIRDGEHAIIRFEFKQINAGTSGTGDYLFPLPTGLNIDYTKMAIAGGDVAISHVGEGEAMISGSTFYDVKAYTQGSGAYDDKIFVQYSNDTQTPIYWSSSFGNLTTASHRISFTIRVPIEQWAGGGIHPLTVNAQSPVKAGVIMPFAGATVPTGWMLADGSEISQTTYPDLFASLGTTWNTGARQDGTGGNYSAPSAGNFRIPDLRGSFMRGVGTSSDASGGNDVTVTLGGFTNDQVETHSHVITPDTRWREAGSGAFGTGIVSGTITTPNSYATATTHASGKSGTETRPRNTGVNYIIKVWNDSADLSGFAAATATDSGLLSRYEEGTWTPTTSALTNIGGTATYTSGKYTRIGRMVFASIKTITGLNITTGGGTSTYTGATIATTGLPSISNTTTFRGSGLVATSGNDFIPMAITDASGSNTHLFFQLDIMGSTIASSEGFTVYDLNFWYLTDE